jgi:hypothetical protein
MCVICRVETALTATLGSARSVSLLAATVHDRSVMMGAELPVVTLGSVVLVTALQGACSREFGSQTLVEFAEGSKFICYQPSC